MFHEKITYYRKKNMMTQEELAEKLCVSRQTVTKWESGLISPCLEYLIDLSHVFGVTIDTLIQDDDCLSEEISEYKNNDLIDFIVLAKQSTYASQNHKLSPLRKESHDYMFEDGEYQYYDSFFGSSCFSGQEVVYYNHKVCWSMNYYGRVLDDHFSGDFLKEVLLHVDKQKPYRGRDIYKKGEYVYVSSVVGDVNLFQGKEDIYYQSQKIYEGLFHGGVIG